MTLVLVTTPGAANANAYCSLEEAEDYMASTVWTDAWTGKSDAQKVAAIANAARMMDTILWAGMRSSQSQTLAWPRCANLWGSSRTVNLTTPSVDYLLDRDGYLVATDSIPVCVKNANAEFALRLLDEDRAADAGSLISETLKIGSIEQGRQTRRPIPMSVYEMVREFLVHSGGPRLVRS